MYICPMHPEIRQDRPGQCPICGMALRLEGVDGDTHTSSHSENSYRPLVIIIGLIALSAIFASLPGFIDGTFSGAFLMRSFMAGFFLVFAGFKLIDLDGFVEGYATYDLLARRWRGYGYVYPFLELALGLLYLTDLYPLATSLVTLILLSFSGLGVAKKLASGEQFQCACLGTFLKVPLTKVTLIEDFGMAAMALIMLVLRVLV